MPTVSELLSAEYPQQFATASQWRARLEEVEAERSIFERAWPDRPQPPGSRVVLGVALTAFGLEEGAAPLAAVLVWSNAPAVLELLPGQGPAFSRDVDPEAFSDLRRLRAMVAEVVETPTDEVAVIGLPAPVEQVGPGDEAHCGVGAASFGSRVTTQAGARGILTAGHAAPNVSTGAYDASGQRLGTVVDSVRCASVGAGVPTPDVAIVGLDAGTQDTAGTAPAGAAVGTAALWDQVTAYGAVTGGQSAAVLAAGTPFAGTSSQIGVFGEAILTAWPISAGGDSGAPAYNQRGELVAHVVAGSAGVYSVLQDVTYQLGAFNTTLR